MTANFCQERQPFVLHEEENDVTIKMMRKLKKQLVYLILSTLTLFLILLAKEQITFLLTKAAPKPANIIIDTKNIIGPITNSWSAFAQGGEEPPPMLSTVVPQLKTLSPRYIRIDHIYDSYSIVERAESGFVYDFSRLDKTVDDIIASGALPFLCLSYMPSYFTSSSSIIDTPSDWDYWKDLVKATIEHYSGKQNRNLNNVYYEVWNEPELPQFGSWKLSSDKDYRLLYFYASLAAKEATSVNNFYLGGPSVGSYYPVWVNDFLSYVTANNLRLDFYSWHRYTKNPNEYVVDSKNIRKILSAFPGYADIPLVLSEWSVDSNNTPIHNSNPAASFTTSAISKFHRDLNLAFAFEIKDGPPPAGGKWGIITHEKDTSPLSQKPRFKAFAALAKLTGNQIYLTGEGTFVSGLAASSSENITVVLSNYDFSSQNTESVPVTFTGLAPSSYYLKYTYPLEDSSGTYEIVTTNGSLSKTFLIPPNSILLLELTVSAPLANFIPGPSGKTDDQALVLKNTAAPLIFTSPEFHLLPFGSIGFDLKPFWDKDDNSSFLIFEAPYSTASGIINKLFLAKQKTAEENLLVFGIAKDIAELTTFLPIDNWEKDSWHRLDMGWEPTGLFLSVDGGEAKKIETTLDIRNGKILTFYPIEAALDNLKIVIGGQQVIERQFDGRIDK